MGDWPCFSHPLVKRGGRISSAQNRFDVLSQADQLLLV